MDKLQQVKIKINNLKRRINKQVKRKGIYENLGQEELRELFDFIGADFYGGDYFYRQKLWQLIDEFRNWCENYKIKEG